MSSEPAAEEGVVGRETWWRSRDMIWNNKKPQVASECGLFCAALYSWWAAINFATCLQWKCKNFGICFLQRRLPLLIMLPSSSP